jgi:hypothetical protein
MQSPLLEIRHCNSMCSGSKHCYTNDDQSNTTRNTLCDPIRKGNSTKVKASLQNCNSMARGAWWEGECIGGVVGNIGGAGFSWSRMNPSLHFPFLHQG